MDGWIITSILIEVRESPVVCISCQCVVFALCSALASEPTVILMRNLVVAPVTEEIAFRGLMVPALFSSCCLLGTAATGTGAGAGAGAEAAAFISFRAPIFFGVAHAHHVYEKVWIHGESTQRALVSTLVQLTYTCISEPWHATCCSGRATSWRPWSAT